MDNNSAPSCMFDKDMLVSGSINISSSNGIADNTRWTTSFFPYSHSYTSATDMNGPYQRYWYHNTHASDQMCISYRPWLPETPPTYPAVTDCQAAALDTSTSMTSYYYNSAPDSSTAFSNPSHFKNSASPYMWPLTDHLNLLKQPISNDVCSNISTPGEIIRKLPELTPQLNDPVLPAVTHNSSPTCKEDKLTPHSRVYKRLFKRKGVLNPIAVRIMTAWYNNNSEHPYPSYESAQVMATAGDITVDQVKKWFANRRRRSNNTKPMKEIAQRRKVTKRSRCSMDNDDILFTDAKRARDS